MSRNPNADVVRKATKPLALLHFYFSGSVELGDCSSMGIILDRLETFSERRGVCRRCRVTGLRFHKQLSAWTALHKEFAERFPDSQTRFDKLNPPPSNEDCTKCHGTRSVVVRGYASCPDCRGKRAGCSRCGGTGQVWRSGHGGEITARPTGSSKELSSGKEPNYDSIIELAKAGRVMAAVPERQRTVLEAFHGGIGDHCEGLYGNRMTAAVLCAAAMPEHAVSVTPDGDRERTQNAIEEVRQMLDGCTTANQALTKIRELQTHPERTAVSKILERAGRHLIEAATDAWVSACEEIAN